MPIPPPPSSDSSWGLARALPHTDWVSLAIGSATLAIYYGLTKWKPDWPVFAIALILASAVFGSLIRFHVPPFQGAATFTTFGFDELMPRMPHLLREGIFNDISALLGVALAIAFLASLENTLMAKALASRSGDHADVNQDMFSVGMANIASAIAGGMPASGSLTRSTLNFDSGARTRFASLFSGVFSLGFAILIAASAGWGVPLIDYIPKAALAALVIALSFSLFNLRNIRICLRSTGDDAVVLVTTFVSTLLAPLHVAIFIGVAVSISLFLRKASRPHLVEYEFSDEGELREMGEKRKRPIPAISIVHVEGDLFFGAAELFRTQIQRTVSDPAIQVIILRLKNARHLDATSVMALGGPDPLHAEQGTPSHRLRRAPRGLSGAQKIRRAAHPAGGLRPQGRRNQSVSNQPTKPESIHPRRTQARPATSRHRKGRYPDLLRSQPTGGAVMKRFVIAGFRPRTCSVPWRSGGSRPSRS